MDNKIFQHVLMLPMLILMLHMLSFYFADVVFGCCMNRPMEDVPIERWSAAAVK